MDGLLYVNKPKGWTSFDVVAKIRKIYHTGCGHTGTLDPQATGVLIVMVGKACKAGPYLVHDTKEYIASMKLGLKTDTADIWGNIVDETEPIVYEEKRIIDILNSMLGKQMQVPPMYSAVKVNGKKLYEYAREGKTVEVEPREIEIFDISFINYCNHEITFKVHCSSGTYIRTLCESIASKLGTLGTMSSLVRTKAGSASIEDCFTLEEILDKKPIPCSIVSVLADRYSLIEVNENLCRDIQNGKTVMLNANEEMVCAVFKGQAIAMMEHQHNGYYRSKRGLWIQ